MTNERAANIPPAEAYWEFIDVLKDAFDSERWQGVLMECSKNELLALVHVFRTGETSMSRIAEYVGVPLNTATGIANRLEKRGLVARWRSDEDKRVMVVLITEEGARQFRTVMDTVESLVGELFADLSDEERRVLFRVIARVPALLEREGGAGQAAGAGSGQDGARTTRRIAIE